MKHHYLPALLILILGGAASGKTVPTNAAANLVLGQNDFVSGALNPITSSFTLSRPEGVVIDPMTRKVFVADFANNRVLRYPDANTLTNGAGAEAVFGQPRFSSITSGTGELNLSGSIGIHFDRKGRLWVSDTANHRVLMYEAASFRSDQPFPERVFGQPNFTTVTPNTSSTGMRSPGGLAVDSEDRLWVADIDNRRVLRFDSISTKANGAAADGVLGQPNFTSSAAATTASNMDKTFGLTISNTGTLFVADSFNNRVLRFNNAAALGLGAGATAVLGQTDFNTKTTGLTANTMDFVVGVFITPDDTLWVTDRDNQRLLRFDKASALPNGSAASGVVGQPNFTTKAAAVTSQGSIISFSQPFVDPAGNLWIADTEHFRVLRFPADGTKPKLVVTTTIPKTTSASKFTIKGTASDSSGITKVQFKVNNGAFKTATGTANWTFKASLKSGDNTITIFAIDGATNQSVNKVIKVKRTSGVAPRLLASAE